MPPLIMNFTLRDMTSGQEWVTAYHPLNLHRLLLFLFLWGTEWYLSP